MTDATLHRLLDDNVEFDLTGRGTVNHLPMALVALARLGAVPSRLEAYARWWRENRALPRVDSGFHVGRGDWRAHLGERQAFDALSACFRAWIADAGADAVLRAVFPALDGGLAASAFHGVIRLAYGVEAGHDGEIAAGLAMLGATHLDLGVGHGAKSPTPSVEVALAQLAAALAGRPTGRGTITARLRAVAADPDFAASLPTAPALPAEQLLAQAAINLYHQTGDFTVLHMVTATHAARVLFTAQPPLATPRALQTLWTAYGAAYAAVGAPPLASTPPAEPTRPWPEIFSDAIASDDDHVIKMTYSCFREGAHYGSPLYRMVASRLAAAGTS